jgi:hypothetical protein
MIEVCFEINFCVPVLVTLIFFLVFFGVLECVGHPQLMSTIYDF